MKAAAAKLPVTKANTIIKMANKSMAKCKTQIASMDKVCAKLANTGKKPVVIARENAYRIKTGYECKSTDKSLGKFDDYK